MNLPQNPATDINLWASGIAAKADLPDQRLNTRLAQILATLASKPLDSIPQACGSFGQAKALYNFLSNQRFGVDALLRPLVATTVETCRRLPVILAIQDTTSLNFSTLHHTTGLGPLNDSIHAHGLHLHTTLAVRLDGLPLGLLHQTCWSRSTGPNAATADWPLDGKESGKWLLGIDAATTACQSLPADEQPRLIHLMDREGDVHEVLQRITDLGQGAVIRCAQNRSVAGPIGLAQQAVAATPLLGIHTLEVPAQHGQRRRRAQLELRATTLTITPDAKKHPQRRPVTWTLIEAREVQVPDNIAPLHWLLWTTEAAPTVEAILEALRLYKLRWKIEDFHLILKSGCQAEALELETSVRLTKAITLYAAVAARLLTLRDLARLEPNAPCTTILSRDAWRVLWLRFAQQPLRDDTPAPTARQALLWIGRLGGHLGRKRDGLPGVRTLWRGWRDLSILVAGYRAACQLH
jgi:Transposase DNA-binding/Transposase Tn5 dimerisation domain